MSDTSNDAVMAEVDRLNGFHRQGATGTAAEILKALLNERERAKLILVECVAAIGNGAFASEQCSLDFMSRIPGEIAGVMYARRTENEDLRVCVNRLVAAKLETKRELAEAMAEIARLQSAVASAGCRS